MITMHARPRQTDAPTDEHHGNRDDSFSRTRRALIIIISTRKIQLMSHSHLRPSGACVSDNGSGSGETGDSVQCDKYSGVTRKVWRATLDPHSYNDVRKLCESEASVVRSFRNIKTYQLRHLATVSPTSSLTRPPPTLSNSYMYFDHLVLISFEHCLC